MNPKHLYQWSRRLLHHCQNEIIYRATAFTITLIISSTVTILLLNLTKPPKQIIIKNKSANVTANNFTSNRPTTPAPVAPATLTSTTLEDESFHFVHHEYI